MKAFLTGANGFIGSHLARQLAARGDTVVALARDPTRVGMDLRLPNIQWVKGDVTEPASMSEAMKGADVVYHLAGMYEFGPKFVSRMHVINVDGARNVLEMAAELGVPKIIHTSTVGVFGNTRGEIVDETYRTDKTELPSEYERTKWEAHYEVAVPLQQKGAPVIITQPGGVTGAGDTSPHMQVMEFYLNHFPMGFGAKSGLTMAHVDDIAAGHILAAEQGKNGQAYILAGPCLTYKQMQEIWEKITGIPTPKVWAPSWMIAANQAMLSVTERLGIPMPLNAEALSSLKDYTFWGKPDKAVRELGWQARPVEETFREVLDYEMKKRAMKK
jgi:nucleoside-diphosphate-sugar epimerase